MSSGFVTETELAEARQKRQEEWEKVRQPDQPLGNTFPKIYNTCRNMIWIRSQLTFFGMNQTNDLYIFLLN